MWGETQETAMMEEKRYCHLKSLALKRYMMQYVLLEEDAMGESLEAQSCC